MSAPRWRRVARYGNEAVLPFYVLHEPVIVAVAWVVVRWPAPLPVKYLLVVAASFIPPAYSVSKRSGSDGRGCPLGTAIDRSMWHANGTMVIGRSQGGRRCGEGPHW